jgi:hypothetical protein
MGPWKKFESTVVRLERSYEDTGSVVCKNINKTDKHIHSHKNRYLEVISRFTRFEEFNGEKKTATKTSNMFKIVPRIGTSDADGKNLSQP